MSPVRCRALRFPLVLILLSALLLAVCMAQAPGQKTPYWAYVLNPPSSPTPANDRTLRHVPNSSASFTFAQTQDYFQVADWHPAAHPPMPTVVAFGRRPDVYACAFCHLPNAQGKPENSSLAGLPAAYIIQQMADFKSGLRTSSEPNHVPVSTMIAKVAVSATDDEVQSAASYFSSLQPHPWIRVIETATVPKTHPAHFMLVPTPGAGTEPIGHRIIEMPGDLERTELRDDASGFIAYVPVGSLAKGKTLVNTGSGLTLPCATCHGTNLRGLANVPSIAGRSPSYLVRQFLDMQSGARHGGANVLMQPVVARLSLDDIIAISAYLASLHP